MFRALTRLAVSALLLACLAAAPALAECQGRDLFAALPKKSRLSLEAEAAAVPHGEGLIFRARKSGQEITLAGTFHLPDTRHQALIDELAPALAKARVLMVEAGPEEESRLKQAVASDPGLMFATSGPTLPEQLPEADWQALRALLAQRGVPAVLAAKMKPAFLAITLSVPPCAMTELQAGGGGLDKALIAKAQAQGLPIAALEPWDTVLTLFDGITPEQNAEILRTIRIDATDAEDNTVTMGNLYFARKPRLIWSFARARAVAMGLSPEEADKQMDMAEELLTDARNRAWVPVLEAAAEKAPVLAAFGALHLSGEQGVLALLAADGWSITRLD